MEKTLGTRLVNFRLVGEWCEKMRKARRMTRKKRRGDWGPPLSKRLEQYTRIKLIKETKVDL